MDDCIFCRIIARRAPAYVIHEDDRAIVFLSLEGHPLVVPRAHIPDIYTLDDDTAAAIMRTAVRLANAVKAALRCDGVSLTQANEPAAGQDVFHFHLHIYPRWHGDGMRVIGPSHQTDPAALAQIFAPPCTPPNNDEKEHRWPPRRAARNNASPTPWRNSRPRSIAGSPPPVRAARPT